MGLSTFLAGARQTFLQNCGSSGSEMSELAPRVTSVAIGSQAAEAAKEKKD